MHRILLAACEGHTAVRSFRGKTRTIAFTLRGISEHPQRREDITWRYSCVRTHTKNWNKRASSSALPALCPPVGVWYCTHEEASLVHPLLTLEVATPENNSIDSTLSSSIKKHRPPYERFLSRTHLTLHVTRRRRSRRFAPGAGKQTSARSGKTRRAPSRYCRDARSYDYTTTAMDDVSAPSPAPPPHRPLLVQSPTQQRAR